MKTIDRVRQVIFVAILGWFIYKAYTEADFIPYPKWMTEDHKAKWKAAKLDEDWLQDGDIVLRHARGFVSDAILTFSTDDPQYSHSGVVRKKDGRAYVYHATGGEEHVTNEMKWDHISIYCHPASIFKFGIFRWDLPDDQMEHFLSILDRNYEKGVEFDLDFDMTTDETQYCSEMIYKALDTATSFNNFVEMSYVGEKPYVAIDKLYLNDKTTTVFTYDYSSEVSWKNPDLNL